MGISCCICLESLQTSDEGVRVASTPCGHLFHYHCIEQWRAAQRSGCESCPLCKQQYKATREVLRVIFLSHDDAQPRAASNDGDRPIEHLSLEECQLRLASAERQLLVATRSVEESQSSVVHLERELMQARDAQAGWEDERRELQGALKRSKRETGHTASLLEMERAQRQAAEKEAKAATRSLEELRLESDCQLARLRALEESIPNCDEDARWLDDMVRSCHPAAAITELGTMLQRTQRECSAHLAAASAAQQREEEAWDKYGVIKRQRKELARKYQKLKDELFVLLKERQAVAPSRQALPQKGHVVDPWGCLDPEDDPAAPNGIFSIASSADAPVTGDVGSRPCQVLRPLDRNLPTAQAVHWPSNNQQAPTSGPARTVRKADFTIASVEASAGPLVISVNSRRMVGQSGPNQVGGNPFAIPRMDDSRDSGNAPELASSELGGAAEGNWEHSSWKDAGGGENQALAPLAPKPRLLLPFQPMKENRVPSFARAVPGVKGGGSGSLPATAPPKFILSGPDGMGGRTTVFRTNDTANMGGAQAPTAKRARTSGSASSAASAASKQVTSRTLEHFFAKG